MRPSFSAILVNAPIGYRDRQIDPQRQCDIEARKLLGRRGVVIRRVPSREVLTRDIALESDHLDAVTRTMLPVVIQVSQEMSAYRQLGAVYEGDPSQLYWLKR